MSDEMFEECKAGLSEGSDIISELLDKVFGPDAESASLSEDEELVLGEFGACMDRLEADADRVASQPTFEVDLGSDEKVDESLDNIEKRVMYTIERASKKLAELGAQ